VRKFLPSPLQRLRDPDMARLHGHEYVNYDGSATGDVILDAPEIEVDYVPPVLDGRVMLIKNLPLQYFRERLIEHFDIVLNGRLEIKVPVFVLLI